MPGVQTPLGWSIWGPLSEEALRRTFHAIGALSKSEIAPPLREEDRVLGIFYGHVAMHLDVICSWADRIPGTSGEAMATQVFGYVPPSYVSRAARRYYPRVAARMATPFLRGPRQVHEIRRSMEAFWRRSINGLAGLGEQEALNLLLEAAEACRISVYRHTLVVLGAVQPAYEMLGRLAAPTGVPVQELMSGYGGHEETAVVADLWACSHGDLHLSEFLSSNGYQGPDAGNIAAIVWRENPEPVERLIESYRTAGTPDPIAAEAAQANRRRELEATLIAALPRSRRPAAKVALRLAAHYLPLRGVGKAAFLQANDVARGAARRLGEHLHQAGRLTCAEDIFFLTIDELRDGLASDAADFVADRRDVFERYSHLHLPETWQGEPQPIEVQPADAFDALDGVGASPGIVEGPVRVIADPAQVDVEPGEILVARTTDPSWASAMYLSAGLIADIGGVMSHTAVVARELGIPCVVNARTATRQLVTGDRVRLDGHRGRVELLSRKPQPERTQA